ncbi:tetratricopeptide repeat protein [Thiocystis violacea]|uniref:tetratricopeptide repeat protein n=1 Tax=Thiocystis violacea TaxID=13725 RepID=UPI001903D370|nr:SEL1-like repeat protein [Thiocystis violacea]
MHTPSPSLQAVTENLMAREWSHELFRAAERGDAEAQRQLGGLYVGEAWYDEVAAEAVKWLDRAAQQGHADAQFELAFHSCPEFTRDLPELQNDPEATFKWMLAAAEQGHAEAIDYMGDIYAQGLAGVPQDENEAVKWYLLGARRDLAFPHSLIDLIKRRACRISMEDEFFVVDLIRKEAEEGKSHAQRCLGNIYTHGLVWLAADDEEAVKWHSLAAAEEEEFPPHGAFDEKDIEVFRRNADRCGARLQRHLGELFEKGEYPLKDGEYLECDIVEAARWYELSATQSDALAQFKIALMYDQGQGVSQNDKFAAKWYEKAAEQDLSAAQNNLGTMYDSGRGVEQNHRLARRWFLAAARQGNETALYNLGLIYQHGQGVREDKTVAQRWFSASATRGYVWAKIALALVTEDPSDLLSATESLFLEHKEVALGRMEDCVSQLEEFRERLDDLVKRSPAPRNTPIWESSWDGSNDDRRHWWKKLSVTARIATTLRGMLFLVDDEADETEAKACFDLAAKNDDQLAAYYLATLEWRNKAYDLALQFVQQRVHPKQKLLVAYSSDGPEDPGYYSEDFQEKLDLWFQELIQNIRESKTSEELHQAKLKAAEDSHKRTLSFLTHTLNNTLSTGPETVRTVIETLGSDLYDQGPAQYKAINNMASLLPVFLFAESLLKTFKLYVSDPEQLRAKWDSDHSGDSTVSLVMAMALRQSIARFVFSPNQLVQLKRLLPGQDKEAIKQVRKSFVEEMIPLELSVETAGKVFDWVKAHFGMLQVEIAADAEMRFSSNATRYMFFFAAFSELVYNALKYSDGARPIQLRWYRDGSDYCFTCVNSCPVATGAQWTQEGTNTGLFFIDKLMSMLRESGLSCVQEDGEYRASLRFDHNNFGERDA